MRLTVLAALALSAASGAQAFSSDCRDECTTFWALSCPTNDPTCVPTYCSSKSYDLYQGCLACWEASPDATIATPQKSAIYQFICALVEMCDIRNAPIPGPAPANIGCAGGAGTGAAAPPAGAVSSSSAAVSSSGSAAAAASPSPTKKSAGGRAAAVGAGVLAVGIAAGLWA
ncbi:hypothetical protein Q8F55_005976 [Vanrija albida]|uniref:Extracellular membrane protein CFEM domain-containing protein n=1 Tax=Vanrija albida TaxID=181172 RepID=A0ABR3Q3X1_9TREE